MKYSLRKSFNARRRKEIPDPTIDAHGCSNSNSNLVNPVKSKNYRSPSSDKNKSEVFEPRYDTHSCDGDDDEPFSSSENARIRPLDRLTSQIRKSFRNTLTRRRSRFESINSDKHLILNKNDENPQQIPILPPSISTGLTSPLPIAVENKRKKMNQSISLPIEINPEPQNFNRSIRTRFSFLRKKPDENSNQKQTLTQRFNSLRRSFHFGNRNSSNKGKRYLLSNE